MFAVRSKAGKGIADLLLAKDMVTMQAGPIFVGNLRFDLLRLFQNESVDPSAVLVLRAFLDDLRWRHSGCGHEACGKPWNSTMKKCAHCQAVSYCGMQCQTADWPRHKAACQKPSAPASST
eukprot:TRINITY_DN1888_c3_g1_i1.p3 TRINITY_DN1888_c3_g1~~TRINITY_DN1888_c3_g1_i1.p3  ORF type:complete len:121 (+),score=31.81 TRINITY_DN1888_c3_g1_i1:158-520(+)